MPARAVHQAAFRRAADSPAAPPVMNTCAAPATFAGNFSDSAGTAGPAISRRYGGLAHFACDSRPAERIARSRPSAAAHDYVANGGRVQASGLELANELVERSAPDVADARRVERRVQAVLQRARIAAQR
jgi:hypothetical protein